MSKRQVQKMLRLMASCEPVELTSPLASVKKLARLAFIAQQFGYEYVDVRQSAGRNNALVMLIAPDPSPQARARAGQNWAQYPNASDGVSVPPLVPDAFELLKARINFDLTGKNAEKRMAYGAIGLTVGAGVLGVRLGADAAAWITAVIVWVIFMAIIGIGFAVNRKRNAKFAARLQAAGFAPITDETGRVRYLPPGGQLPGHGNPFAAGPYGNQAPAPAPAPGAPAGYGQQVPGPYGQPAAPGAYPAQPAAPGAYPAQPAAPGAYPAQPAAPGPYGNQPAPGPYGAPQPQGPYGTPQQPQPQPPYGQPQPYPPQQSPQPPQPPHPQQNPHWQPPQR
ncbi:hypothetical protein EJ357_17755 [Streptomyces cyaneochromogenes]|uniref:Integral membrane protein n=1 Tax=Streptomyces cyaneochromogenes TaxID=2496836 RepID=A0A3S9M7B0_9ACTN|nr:hypothetical protein [Streptomyces cyaneochromogenes]AZQ35113.1 hypothetical protein EJ357_17755 [Streptomyces cyaneochromogenes]